MPGASKRRGKSDKQNQGQAAPAPSAPAEYDGPQDGPSSPAGGGRGRGGGRGGGNGRGGGRGGAQGGGHGAPNAPSDPISAAPSVRSQSPAVTTQPIARDPAREPQRILNKNVDFAGNAYNLINQVSSKLCFASFVQSKSLSALGFWCFFSARIGEDHDISRIFLHLFFF